MTPKIRLPLLFATVALILAAFAPTAGAWRGANGAIVFEAFVPGGEDLGRGTGIRIAPLGGDRTEIATLTDDPADHGPAVSPDGRLVVFTRDSTTEPSNSAPSTIYVIGTDGSGLRPITDGRHSDGQPAFAASGARIYFCREVASGSNDVFSVGLDGRGLRHLTSGPASDNHPRAAAGGRIIAFERRMSGPSGVRFGHIFTARVDGSHVRDLTPRLPRGLFAADPEFSPDGRRVAYSTGDRLLSVRTNRSRPRLLLGPRVDSDDVYDPTYSPDGASLLFITADQGGRSNLRRLDLRTLRRLPNPLVEPHVAVRSPGWLRTGRNR
jgi:Tol biopolymer transport system component